jgi:hypothetical protein
MTDPQGTDPVDHHWFPQEFMRSGQWDALGIDGHEWVSTIPSDQHTNIHGVKGDNYNQWFRDNLPDAATIKRMSDAEKKLLRQRVMRRITEVAGAHKVDLMLTLRNFRTKAPTNASFTRLALEVFDGKPPAGPFGRGGEGGGAGDEPQVAAARPSSPFRIKAT